MESHKSFERRILKKRVMYLESLSEMIKLSSLKIWGYNEPGTDGFVVLCSILACMNVDESL